MSKRPRPPLRRRAAEPSVSRDPQLKQPEPRGSSGAPEQPEPPVRGERPGPAGPEGAAPGEAAEGGGPAGAAGQGGALRPPGPSAGSYRKRRRREITER